MKYAINNCYGGFGLSQEALEYLRDVKGWKVISKEVDVNSLYYSDCQRYLEKGYKLYDFGEKESLIGPLCTLESMRELSFRSNPDVIEAIEALGEKANGKYAKIIIVEAPYSPEEDKLEIDEYDGVETLQTIPERF